MVSSDVLIPTDTFLPTFSQNSEVVTNQSEKTNTIDLDKEVSVVSVGISNDVKSMVLLTDTSTDTPTDTSAEIERAIATPTSIPFEQDELTLANAAPMKENTTPVRSPFLNIPVFRVGDHCRYCGPPGAMAATCIGKILDVLELRSRDGLTECRIKFEAWVVDYWVAAHHLRRVSND